MLKEADRIGFDHQVQYGMWKGYGGATQWNDAGLDFATAAAASATVTQKMNLFSTVHVSFAFHPMHIVKMGACIDFISGGRWGLNIVTGSNPEAFRMFGYDGRPPGPVLYDMADEFVTLMKYLWAYDDPVDFEGEYYQCYGGLYRAKASPQTPPHSHERGPIRSRSGLCLPPGRWAFVTPPSGQIADYVKAIEKTTRLAAKYERRLQIGAMCYAVMEDTDSEAAETVAWLEEEGDREAIRYFVNSVTSTGSAMKLGEDDGDPYVGLGRDQFNRIAAGMIGYQFFGGYETVAEKMRELHEVGVDNLVIGFFDPQRGLRQMEEHVIPILKRMGLRN